MEAFQSDWFINLITNWLHVCTYWWKDLTHAHRYTWENAHTLLPTLNRTRVVIWGEHCTKCIRYHFHPGNDLCVLLCWEQQPGKHPEIERHSHALFNQPHTNQQNPHHTGNKYEKPYRHTHQQKENRWASSQVRDIFMDALNRCLPPHTRKLTLVRLTQLFKHPGKQTNTHTQSLCVLFSQWPPSHSDSK